MIVSKFLEKLIWEGKAEYKTWTIGTPAAGLNVGENETVIITGFEYCTYIDPEEAVLADFDNFISRINKQIVFSDKSRRFVFFHRAELSINVNDLGALVNLPDGNVHTYQSYMVFEDNVSMNITNVPSPDNWTILPNAEAPKESEQSRTPLAYGTTATSTATGGAVSTPQRVKVAPLTEIRPFPAEIADPTLPAGSTSYDDFQVPTDGDDPFFDVQPEIWGGFTFPLLTVHYVRINKRLVDTFI